MAKVWGQDGTGWTQTSTAEMSFSAGAACFAAGYVAPANAVISSFNVFCGAGPNGAASYQVCFYQGASPSTGGATLLGTSSAIAPVASTLQNLPVTAINIVAGQTYSAFVSCSTSSITFITNSGASAFVDSQYNSTHFPFATPPATTFNPRDSGTGREFIIWADGSTVVTGDAGDSVLSLFNRGPGLAGPFSPLTFNPGPFNSVPGSRAVLPAPQSQVTGVYRRRFHRYT